MPGDQKSYNYFLKETLNTLIQSQKLTIDRKCFGSSNFKQYYNHGTKQNAVIRISMVYMADKL